jgi:hypothetical protein
MRHKSFQTTLGYVHTGDALYEAIMGMDVPETLKPAAEGDTD